MVGRTKVVFLIIPRCWTDVAMVVVMFDVCKESSLASAARWLEGVTKSATAAGAGEGSGDDDDQRRRRLPGVLLANKTDLKERRLVRTLTVL